MEHDQEMHAPPPPPPRPRPNPYPSVYPLHIYHDTHAAPSYLNQPEESSQRYPPVQDAFRSRDHHEAEHVYNSLPLALDPSTLNLSPDNLGNSLDSAGPSGSNTTTPTGSLRLRTYNPHHDLSSSTHGSKRRETLEHLQIHIPPGALELSSHSPFQDSTTTTTPPQDKSQHQHQPGDIQAIDMHASDMHHIHLEGNRGQHMMSGIGQEHSPDGNEAHSHHHHHHHMYSGLEHHHPPFFMSHNNFANSPTNSSTPSDASPPQSDLQLINTAPAMPSSNSPSILGRPFRSGSLSMGLSNAASRPMSLIPPSSPLSPTHVPGASMSPHPHMYPAPYMSGASNTGSPGYPTTPATSHHTQGSSSSSHSSGHTRHSFRGSPVPHFHGGHGRSNSYGTMSTISVRSASPASSVASGLTSLSGGPGSAPPSTAPQTGSPMHFGDCSDTQMSYGDGSSPPNLTSSHPRAQSHSPHALSPTHTTLAYPSFMANSRRPFSSHGGMGFPLHPGHQMMDVSADPHHPWPPRPEDFMPVSAPAQRLTDEGFQSHYAPKPAGSRAPHRKQKLANSDRKAICMYAKQHPSARQEDIAARYNVERSTISKILKNKERWLGCPDDDAKVARKRKPRFDDLELVLKQWVEETRPQKIVLSDALIRSKAKEEARRLGILEDKFKASSGWLENFKHRVGIRKGKYVGRDNLQEGGGIFEQEDSSSMKVATTTSPGQRGPWSPESNQSGKAPWHPEAKQEEANLLQSTTTTTTSAGIPRQEPALPPLLSDFCQENNSSNNNGVQGIKQDYLEMNQAPQQGDDKLVPGMRKTRSRTLAEARQAQASLSPGGSVSSSGSNATIATGGFVDPSMSMGSARYSASFDGRSSSSPGSPSTPASASSNHAASVGLHTALDFIGSQPHGYTTPEQSPC